MAYAKPVLVAQSTKLGSFAGPCPVRTGCVMCKNKM